MTLAAIIQAVKTYRGILLLKTNLHGGYIWYDAKKFLKNWQIWEETQFYLA